MIDFAAFGATVLKIADGLKTLRTEAENRNDARLTNIALKAENDLLGFQLVLHDVRKENEELRRRLSLTQKMVYDPSVGVYYRVADEEDSGDNVILRDGPYCPACFDKDLRAAHITVGQRHHGPALSLLSHCPVCEAKFHKLFEDHVFTLPKNDSRLLYEPS
jgi:hypothetical protein